MKGVHNKLSWGFALGLVFATRSLWAQLLPVSFISSSNITNMPAGQVQQLNYTIRSNVRTQFLPITISIVNDGDNQPMNAVTQTNTCGGILAPNASCSITVTVQALKPGPLLRHLNINYRGRAPLISPLVLGNVPIANTTVLVYIVGSDLETKDNAATVNIAQMQEIGSTANLNIVIETGGAKKLGWLTVKRQLVQKRSLCQLQDIGQRNMADAAVIQDFVSWGISNFPAQKYILIFWDHGSGPNDGFGGDQNYNMASTPINQLIPAVQKALQATGARLELIGFDTCLLGNAELAAGLAPLANYLVGSEDLEPGAGWQYNTFLDYVNSNLAATGLDIGAKIVNGYTTQNNGKTTTLSVTDLSQITNIVNAVNQFSTALSPYVNSNATNWKQVAQTRIRSADYNTSVWTNYNTDVVDLIGFAANIQNKFSFDTALFNAAEAVITTTQSAVKYFKNSVNRGASLGLTTYFPSLMADYQTNYGSNVSINGVSFYSQNYINLLNEYNSFYKNNLDNLTANFSNFAFTSPNYTATLSNDYAELFAGVGSQTCEILSKPNNLQLPCIATMQYTGIEATSGGSDTWNISYNATANNQWPLLNEMPILLIDSDAPPSEQAQQSYIIPATQIYSDTRNEPGFLQLMNNNGVYTVVGFLELNLTNTSTNSVSKVTRIDDDTQFYLRAYAQSNEIGQCYNNSPIGTWCLMNTSTFVTAPLTITTGVLPSTTLFNQFAFLAGDLTGALKITATMLPYSSN